MNRKDFSPMRQRYHGLFAPLVIGSSLAVSAWALGADAGSPQTPAPPASTRTLVAGALSGSVPQWSGAVDSLRWSNGSLRFASPMDRKWQVLLETRPHSGARPSQASIAEIFRDLLGRRAAGLDEDKAVFLDEPENSFFGDVKDIREELEREAADKRAAMAAQATNSMADEFQARLAELSRSQGDSDSASTGPWQTFSTLAPISVKHGVYDDGSATDAGTVTIAAGSGALLPPGTSTGGGSTYSPEWYGLPAGNTAPVANWSSASLNMTPSTGATLPPVWTRGTSWPEQASAGTISFSANHGSGSIVPTVPVASPITVSATLPASQIAVAPTVTPVSSLSVSASAVVNSGASGGSLTTALVTAPAGGSGSGTITPLVAGNATIYVANGNGPGGVGFVGAYNGSTGAAAAGFTSPGGFNTPDGAAIGYPVVAGAATPTLYISDDASGTVVALNANTGAFLPGFTTITGLSTPGGVTITGNFLWVASYASDSNATLRQYNATTGAYNNIQITSVSGAYSVAAIGNVIYVLSADNNTGIKAFNATTGAAIAFSSPTFADPNTMESNGNGILYVSTYTPDQLFAYTVATGSAVALAGFSTITLPGTPGGEYDINGDLYTADDDNNTIEEWNALTGASISYTSPSGVDAPNWIAAIPEPGSAGLLAFGGLIVFGRRRRVKRA